MKSPWPADAGPGRALYPERAGRRGRAGKAGLTGPTLRHRLPLVMRRYRLYLLFPLLIFAAAYGVDKLFYIGGIEDYFLRTASFINYDHKEDLLQELETYLAQPERRRVVVLFGNSRTVAFDNAYIESRHPGWILFNFSVPGGNSDYYAYFMERFVKRGLRPDHIYFAVSPQGYNTSPRISMDEVMLNGLSVSFVFRHMDRFSLSDLSNYVAKKLFWNYQYRPKLVVVMRKLRNRKQHIDGFRLFQVVTYFRLLMGRGSVSYDDPPGSADLLEKTARGTWRDFFTPYRQSESMFAFTEDFLADARRLQVPATLLWAKVGSPLRRMKQRKIVRQAADGSGGLTVRELWEPRIRAVAQKHGASFLDMNYSASIKCDSYYDASHLAGGCFHEFADYIFEHAKTRSP